MNAYKVITSIPRDRKLHLDIPLTVPIGPVEIIMVYNESEVILKSSMKKYLDSLEKSSHMRRSKDSIDGELITERASWD